MPVQKGLNIYESIANTLEALVEVLVPYVYTGWFKINVHDLEVAFIIPPS